MGIVMKKLVLAAAVLAVTASSALAADMAVKAKAPPPAPFEPWDIAFGAAIMSDYIFRGVTQSNHKPSVAVYFEPRYNFTKDLQAYVGLAGESIAFPNRAAAEIDIYAGIRPTFGMFVFDIGAWGHCASISGKWTAPSTTFGFSGVGMYISGEFGRQWLGTSDSFYGVVSPLANYAPGIPAPSYNTWNIGVGLTYKVFTLDIRYSDTNLSKASCNAITSDHTTTNLNPGFVSAINPGGFGSNWCSATGTVKLSADLTAITNLK